MSSTIPPRGPGRPRKEDKPFSDFSLLSAEEQASIKEEAEALVAKEASEAARKAFLAQETKAARKRARLGDPEEELVTLVIDVAPFTDRIVIDNVIYMQGSVVEVPKSKARVIKEIMARSWGHEAEIGGANREYYKQPKQTRMNMRTGAVSGAHRLGMA